MNLQEAKELLKNKGYTVRRLNECGYFTNRCDFYRDDDDKKTTRLSKEQEIAIAKRKKHDLIIDELTAIKREFTPEEAKLLGLSAIIGNIKFGYAYEHNYYDIGEAGIVIHSENYEKNPELFKKFTEIAKNHGFEVEYSYVKRGVFVEISWLF